MTSFRIVLIFSAFSIFSVFFIKELSLNYAPERNSNRVLISAACIGSPNTVERKLIAPIETALASMEGIAQIESQSMTGEGQIIVTLDHKIDLEHAQQKILSLLRQIRNKLPSMESYPTVKPYFGKTHEREPFMLLQLYGHLPQQSIFELAEHTLGPKISTLSGIEDIKIHGGTKQGIIISYNPVALHNHGISSAEISQMLLNAFPGVLGSTIIEEELVAIEINSAQNIQDLIVEIEGLTIGPVGGKLQDYAKVYIGHPYPTSQFRLNGESQTTIALYSDPLANMLELASEVKSMVIYLNSQIPSNLSLNISYNQASLIKKELHRLIWRSLASLSILLILLWVIYKNIKHLINMVLSICIVFTLSIFPIWLFGIQIHLYSLAAAAIAIGLVIDNAIIVSEDLLVKQGNSSTRRAVVAATLTTVAAVSMVFLLPKEDQTFLRDFSALIAIVLTISILTSLLFVPALFDLNQVKNRKKPQKKTNPSNFWYQLVQTVSNYKKVFLGLWLLAFGLPIFLLPDHWEGHTWYNRTFGSTMYQEQIKPIVDPLFGGAMRLFYLSTDRTEFGKEGGQAKLSISANLPIGTDPDQFFAGLAHLETTAIALEGVENVLLEIHPNQHAFLSLIFHKRTLPGTIFTAKNQIIQTANKISGIRWLVMGVGEPHLIGTNNSLISGNYYTMLKGYNRDMLQQYANQFKQLLEEDPRVTSVRLNSGISLVDLPRTRYAWMPNQGYFDYKVQELTTRLQGLRARSELQLPTESGLVPIIIEPNDYYNFSFFDFGHTYIKGVESDTYSQLSSIGHLVRSFEPETIHKVNRQFLMGISFDYTGSHERATKWAEEQEATLANQLPYGFSFEKQRTKLSMASNQGLLVIIMILVIFVICSVLFESLRQPLIILLIIPISLIGLFLTYSLFKVTFGPGGFAAIILLGGISVNASIFIINEYNQNPHPNIFDAVKAKAKPILLTVFSTCIGFVPYVFFIDPTDFWYKFGIGVIGGLLFSLIGIFIYVPAMLLPGPVRSSPTPPAPNQ